MPVPSTGARALGGRFRLVLERELRGGLGGERLGRTTGSSLEFQDRRAYSAGDDVRHLDWRAFARTEKLLVRQYREEILPRVDLVLDASKSMAVEDRKADRALDLAAVLVEAAHSAGCRTEVITLGDRPERLGAREFLERGLVFEGRLPLPEALREAAPLVGPGSLRILLSDFLVPHEADDLLRSLGRGAGGLALVQLLGAGDADPDEAACELEDCESGAHLDLLIDGGARARYLERLARLQQGLVVAARRARARFVGLIASESLEGLCRDGLARAGLIEPA